jgi:uncharacterized RDD family membrane protein YckC
VFAMTAGPAPTGRAPTGRAPIAGRRIAAWVVDWLILSAYAGALVPLGLLLVARSVTLSGWAWNAVAFAVLVAPATVWLAGWEGGRRGATPGKRLLRLRVRPLRDGAVGWRPALVRNALKVALPWELGHTAAFLLADPRAGAAAVAAGMICASVACALAAGYVVSLFVGTGRTPYDRAAATRVHRIGADLR